MLYEQIIAREPIEKGWSGDQKFRASTPQGVFLLRISPAERFRRRQHAHEHAVQAYQLGVSMPQPLEFGECPEGIYTVESFVEGTDGEQYIPTLPEKEQYAYGLDAGKALQKLHSLPAPADAPDWEKRFNAKIDRKLAMYEECPLRYENDGPILSYLADNRHLLKNRPQSYQHGDYHIGNMLIDTQGKLTVIDFDRDDYGDPWEEFNRIVWCAQKAPAFACGMVDGYFDGCVPMEFWQLLCLYICSNTLSSLPWAIPFGEGEVEIMKAQNRDILDWYENMTKAVPGWYRKGEELCRI